MSGTEIGPERTYRERAARFAAVRDKLSSRAGALSHLRLACFIAFVALGVLAEMRSSAALAVLAAAALILFFVLIAQHRRVRREERWAADLAELNEQGLHRLAHDWDRLPVRSPSLPAADHAYAGDLDLFGRASITQILGPVATPFGTRTLDGWLLARAQPAVIVERQQAVRELATLHELRETLSLHARAARSIRMQHIERFLRWAEADGRIAHATLLRILSILLPLTTWALIIAHATGVIASSLWLVPAIVSLGIYFTVGARARRTFDEAFGREPLFMYYPQMLAAACTTPFAAPLLQSIAHRFGSDGETADAKLQQLQRLMHLADVRLSSMHLPLFLLTLWDVHLLFSLERWRRAAGAEVRDWLAALGELEALSSLATLAHDRPGWTFPDVAPMDEPLLAAAALGHPLIGDDMRVTNDVSVGPPGTFLLVTGSNMSGKSTLLRALGTNVVLAQAGAPVCAERLRMPPLDVRTSIRVQDSLARGVSYFMAELERLKQVVDAAERVRGTDATQLFLLDEILHGTNTAERRIAATRVIRHLVDVGAIGAATTHDLQLAEEPELTAAARLVHFTETVRESGDGPAMEFDYLLREGIATSTNALVLMRIVGLGAGTGAGPGTRTTE